MYITHQMFMCIALDPHLKVTVYQRVEWII